MTKRVPVPASFLVAHPGQDQTKQWRWHHRHGRHSPFASIVQGFSGITTPLMVNRSSLNHPESVRPLPLAFISPMQQPSAGRPSHSTWITFQMYWSINMSIYMTCFRHAPVCCRSCTVPSLAIVSSCLELRIPGQQQDDSGSEESDIMEFVAARTVYKPLTLAKRELLHDGKYQVLDLLTQGRFTSLWLAKETATSRDVIIKASAALQHHAGSHDRRCLCSAC
jgi:hypothetical protein